MAVDAKTELWETSHHPRHEVFLEVLTDMISWHKKMAGDA